jgi:hypothetical protein
MLLITIQSWLWRSIDPFAFSLFELFLGNHFGKICLHFRIQGSIPTQCSTTSLTVLTHLRAIFLELSQGGGMFNVLLGFLLYEQKEHVTI